MQIHLCKFYYLRQERERKKNPQYSFECKNDLIQVCVCLCLCTFIYGRVMDRLYGTLEDKIDAWEKTLAMHKGCCGVTKKNHPAVKELLKQRLLVAYDLTAALTYLHGFQ